MRPKLEAYCHKMVEELNTLTPHNYFISYRGTKNKHPVLIRNEIVIARGWNGIQHKVMEEYFAMCDKVYL